MTREQDLINSAFDGASFKVAGQAVRDVILDGKDPEFGHMLMCLLSLRANVVLHDMNGKDFGRHARTITTQVAITLRTEPQRIP